MKHAVFLVLATAAATSVLAQGTPADVNAVGKVQAVRGLVTVAGMGRLTNAVAGTPLVAGNRIITTSGGSATLAYDNGCAIKLKANQSFTVQKSAECDALVASVATVGTASGTSVATAGSSGSNNNLLAVGGISIAAALMNGRSSGSVGPTGSAAPTLAVKAIGGGWVPNSSK